MPTLAMAAVEDGDVLVTGGLGYLGGRVAQYLSQRGYRPRLITRRPPHTRPSWAKKFEVKQCDLTDVGDLTPLCSGVGSVLHLAAMNEVQSERHAADSVIVNGAGTVRLLQAAIAAGVKRFIYFSTIHVYGPNLAGRISEQAFARPIHPYAISHRTAEDFVLAAQHQRKIDGIVLRLSNIVGAPADPHVDRWTLVANQLCRQVATEGRLVLRSAGLDYRDFLPMDDVLSAVGHMLMQSRDTLGDGLFNLAGGMSMPVLTLAERIVQRSTLVLGTVPAIERPMPVSASAPQDFHFSIDKLHAIGFQPANDLDSAIDSTLIFCRDALKSSR